MDSTQMIIRFAVALALGFLGALMLMHAFGAL